MAVRILLIDRDLPAVHEVQSTLAQGGYHVEHALPGRNTIRQVVLDEPDLVILAIEADEAGWQFFRRVLSFLDVPLLLLLAGASRLDRATALSQGAAACLLNPVSMVELQAQVQALLRQSLSPADRRAKNYFVDGDLVVDLTRWEVKIDDEPVALTPTEFLLLACLIKHEGRVVSHDQLLLEAWGSDYDTYCESLKQYIHHLRRKLEPDPVHPQRILTRWGRGYMFQRIAAEEDPPAAHNLRAQYRRILAHSRYPATKGLRLSAGELGVETNKHDLAAPPRCQIGGACPKHSTTNACSMPSRRSAAISAIPSGATMPSSTRKPNRCGPRSCASSRQARNRWPTTVVGPC